MREYAICIALAAALLLSEGWEGHVKAATVVDTDGDGCIKIEETQAAVAKNLGHLGEIVWKKYDVEQSAKIINFFNIQQYGDTIWEAYIASQSRYVASVYKGECEQSAQSFDKTTWEMSLMQAGVQ